MSKHDQEFVNVIAECFASCPVGETITFYELSEAIGFDVTTRRELIQAAKNKVFADTKALMESVYKVGYKRLPSDQFAPSMQKQRNRIRRASGRAFKRYSAAVAVENNIAPDQLRLISRELSVLGLVSHLTKDRSVAKIAPVNKPPSFSDIARRTLEALSENAEA